jgi:alkaline phosphatase D
LGPYKDKPSWKLPLLGNFKENWINPYYGTEEWPGTYFNFVIGDVEIFMLDGRIYRTNPWAENPTMLGPAQKEWLLDGLGKSTATFKVIASPVPWSYESKKDAKDTWNGFHEERGEIFDFLADNKINGVFLISADRHRSDAWKIERDQDYPLYEFMSSRLTNQHYHPLESGALFGYNEKPSFGKLTFNTKISDPSVTYDIYNIDNEKIHSMTLTKSMLLHQ